VGVAEGRAVDILPVAEGAGSYLQCLLLPVLPADSPPKSWPVVVVLASQLLSEA